MNLKIWKAALVDNEAQMVDLKALVVPQIYYCIHDDQPEVKICITSSFCPFEEKEGIAFFEFLKALFPGTSFAVVDIVPIAAPAAIGYLGQRNGAATILGAVDHLKIMNGLSDILKEVDGNEAIIILGLGAAGRTSGDLPEFVDDSAWHPCLAYGSCFGMA